MEAPLKLVEICGDDAEEPVAVHLRYGSYQYSQQYSQEQSIKQKQQEIMQQQSLDGVL